MRRVFRGLRQKVADWISVVYEGDESMENNQDMSM